MNIENLWKKADAIFSEKQKKYPALYREENRLLFQEFYVDGYLDCSAEAKKETIEVLSRLETA